MNSPQSNKGYMKPGLLGKGEKREKGQEDGRRALLGWGQDHT